MGQELLSGFWKYPTGRHKLFVCTATSGRPVNISCFVVLTSYSVQFSDLNHVLYIVNENLGKEIKHFGAKMNENERKSKEGFILVFKLFKDVGIQVFKNWEASVITQSIVFSIIPTICPFSLCSSSSEAVFPLFFCLMPCPLP